MGPQRVEADQKAILRQANDTEFERHITHAQMKLRKSMRDERTFNPSPPRARTSRADAPRVYGGDLSGCPGGHDRGRPNALAGLAVVRGCVLPDGSLRLR